MGLGWFRELGRHEGSIAMKRTHTFTADDGTTFATARECNQHEQLEMITNSLCHLEITQVCAALERTDILLSDAFERAGNIIAAKRRASGDVKIRRQHRPSGQLESASAAMDSIKKNMRNIS
jgi:hypothetical protein